MFWRPADDTGAAPRHSHVFSIKVGLDEDNYPTSALVVSGGSQKVLGVDTLRAMLGEKAFAELGELVKS